MKLSVSTYSYNKLVSGGAYTEMELIGLAKEQGFDGIEFSEIHPPEGTDKLAYAKQLAAEAGKQGLEMVSYTIHADFLNGSDGDLEKEIQRLYKEVDIAAALGVSVMRHDATGGFKTDRRQRGFDDALPFLIKGCRAVTEYAKTKGIRTMIENHGTFCQESCRVEKIINGVGDENFGLLVDLGNFLCADEEPQLAVGRLAPYVFHVHAKDFHRKSGSGLAPQDGFFRTRAGNYLRGAIIGHGDVPVFQCLSTLKRAGYDGFVTIEFEGIEEPKLGVSYGMHSLRYYIGLL